MVLHGLIEKIKMIRNHHQKESKNEILLWQEQVSQYKRIFCECQVKIETIASITDTPVMVLKNWIQYGKLKGKEVDGHFYLSGETALRLLSDEKGLLRLDDDYHKPLIPSDAIKASADL